MLENIQNTQSHEISDIIELFNRTFSQTHNTRLVCCEPEPIYRPVDNECSFNRIVFAHGFFSSALHEIAHWCVAGKERRKLEDFGYWYEPDGRSEERQAEFERVEVKPQALEWIFSVASNHPFHFSADNLEGDAQPSIEFMQNVYQQVQEHLTNGLPNDAKLWSDALIEHYRKGKALKLSEFKIPTIEE